MVELFLSCTCMVTHVHFQHTYQSLYGAGMFEGNFASGKSGYIQNTRSPRCTLVDFTTYTLAHPLRIRIYCYKVEGDRINACHRAERDRAQSQASTKADFTGALCNVERRYSSKPGIYVVAV